MGGWDRRRGLADHDRLIGAAALGFLVVGVAGVGGHAVVVAGLRRAGGVGGCVFAVAGDRDGAVGGHQAAFGGVAALVGVELPADRARGVRAEEATELGLVLEGLADRARGDRQGARVNSRDRAVPYGVFGADALGVTVVGVVGVAAQRVVGAGLRRAGVPSCPTRRSSDLRDGAVGGHQAAFGGVAALVGVELPADRARGVRAEEATELGLVLEGLADRAR